MLGSVHCELISDLDFLSNVFAANLILTEAERAARLCRCRAFTPADRADTHSAMLAWWVAQSTMLLKSWRARELSSSSTTVRIFRTADTNVNHFIWAVR
jgi:hypothetical protein